MDYQGRHYDSWYQRRCTGTTIIVIGSCEPTVARRDLIIEITDAAQRAQPGTTKDFREQPCFASHAAPQRHEEAPLVQAIRPLVQFRRARSQVHPRADGSEGLHLGWRAAAPLSGQ